METEALRLERKFQRNTEELRDDFGRRLRDLERRIEVLNSTIEHQAAMLRRDISTSESHTRSEFSSMLSRRTTGLIEGLVFMLAFGVLGYWTGS